MCPLTTISSSEMTLHSMFVVLSAWRARGSPSLVATAGAIQASLLVSSLSCLVMSCGVVSTTCVFMLSCMLD